MTYIYYNSDKEIKMISTSPIKTSLTEVQSNETVENRAGYKPKFENGNVVYEPTSETIKRQDTIAEIDKAKSLDEIKTIIKELI